MASIWRDQTWSGQSLDARRVPRSVHGASQGAEGNSFRDESLGGSGRDSVANVLKVRGHLTGEHFDEAGAVHADGLALIGESLWGDEAATFVEGAFIGHGVAVVEGNEIEALAKYKNVGYAVSAASCGWKIVAAGAGVGVRAREAVEIER